jgi:hypothetical protein
MLFKPVTHGDEKPENSRVSSVSFTTSASCTQIPLGGSAVVDEIIISGQGIPMSTMPKALVYSAALFTADHTPIG